MFAEISDKMPSIAEMWTLMLILSVPALLGLVHKWVSWFVLLVSLGFSAWLGCGAYQQAFLEPGFSPAVQGEMGEIWIANSIASAFLPAVAAFMVLWWHIKASIRVPQENSAATDGPGLDN